MNNRTEKVTGWIKMDAIGESLDKIFKGFSEDKPELTQDINNFRAGRFKSIIITSKYGKKVPVDENVIPIKSETEKINDSVLVFTNIAE